MPDEPKASDDRLLLALTTEHFTLQTARSATIAESNGRILIFLSTLSSSVVALAFVAQSSNFGGPFYAFSLTVLPAMLLIGFATFMRTLHTAVQDAYFAVAISHIREHYKKLHPDAASLLIIPTESALKAVRVEARTTGRPSRIHFFYTAGGMVACVEALVAGVLAAVVLDWSVDDPGAWAVVAGVATTLAVITALFFYGRNYFFSAVAEVGIEPPWKKKPE